MSSLGTRLAAGVSWWMQSESVEVSTRYTGFCRILATLH